MSKLEYFLNPTLQQETKEIVVSNRFKDEKGKPAKIKLRAITQAENDALIKKCTYREKNRNGSITETFDKEKYTAQLILNCIIADPVDAIRKLFLPGEYATISEAILDLMGLTTNIGEQAKN